LIKTIGVVDLLQRSLKPLLRKISVAFVFGSIASGTENSDSDIDLFIIGDVKLMEVVAATKNAEHKLRRSINPIVLSIPEAKSKLKEKNSSFIERIRKSDKMFLMGKDNELGKTFS
jgi:predicted nucleotidyltransferase